MIHESYNLKFANTIDNNQPTKSILFINQDDKTYDRLYFYLAQIQAPNIDLVDFTFPTIQNILDGIEEDNVLLSGSEYAIITNQMTTIQYMNYDHQPTIMPTSDFIAILHEYLEFYNTPPFDSNRIKE